MSTSGAILWLAVVVCVLTAAIAIYYARRWEDWRLIFPVLGLVLVGTGPLIEIAARMGLLEPAFEQRLVDYRWLMMAFIALLAVAVIGPIVDRERRLFHDLAASEQRFRSISHVMPVGVFQADLDGRCVYANEGALEMLGISLGDAVGEGWMRRLHPEDRDHVMEQWQEASLRGSDFCAEYRFKKDDGSTIWVLGHVIVLKDQEGDVVGHVGAITDITERKRNEVALAHSKEALERRVAERTTELVRANATLEREIKNRRDAEAVSAEGEAKLRTILDNTPATIFIKDLSGRYLYINEPSAFPGEKGRRDVVVGKTDRDLLGEEFAAALEEADLRALQAGVPSEAVHSIQGAQGLRHYLTVRFPLTDSEHRAYALAGVSTDITERINVTESIGRIFRLSPAMMCTLDVEGKFMMVTPAFAAALGYTEEEVLGHSYAEFVHPDDVEKTREEGESMWRASRPAVNHENRYRRKDGRYIRLSWQSIYVDSEKTFYAAAADVTQRVEELGAIQKIYQLSPVMMCTYDWDGYITAVNAVCASSLGYTEEEMLGGRFREFVHPEDLEAAVDSDARLRAGETTVRNFEVRIRRKDGSYRNHAWDVSSSPTERLFYGVARDVTDIRKAEKDLAEHKDEMAHFLRLHTMGEMASEIAHELNQPLTSIINYARGGMTRLSGERMSPTEMSTLMEKISAQALRAGDLMRRVRNYAKPTEIELAPCDVNELVRNAIEILRTGTHTKTSIRLMLADRLPRVYASAVQIEQVIFNLVRNAIEAVDRHQSGTVTIRTESSGPSEICLQVIDNGPGLDAAEVDRAFEPFFSRKPGGMGLGLAISRTIVLSHGGRIWCHVNDTEGATFNVVLPVNSAKISPAV